MNADKLQQHVLSTYLTLRYGMAVIAAAFPVILYAGGVLHNLELQNSMSAYYFATVSGDPPMRTWFVGLLFAIGAFLYLYKGFTAKENIALNLAGLFAIGVARFPMAWGCGDDCPKINAHGFCAVALFLCIAFVCMRCSRDTLKLITDDQKQNSFRLRYRIIGVIMIASPLTAFILSLLAFDIHKYVFFIEASGIWAFALFWWTKSSELSQSSAELRALHGKFDTAAPGATTEPAEKT